jgi:hypothetical protein
VVLAFQHLTGRGVGIAAHLNAQAFGVAMVHLVFGELAALHLENLNPLNALPGFLARDWLFSVDAGLDTAAAANALADVQGIAHQHAGQRLGGIHGHFLPYCAV